MIDKSCLFCKIIIKELPTNFIYENDLVVAFNDISPQAPKHILIIPKVHIATLNDLKDRSCSMTKSTLGKTLHKSIVQKKSPMRFLKHLRIQV